VAGPRLERVIRTSTSVVRTSEGEGGWTLAGAGRFDLSFSGLGSEGEGGWTSAGAGRSALGFSGPGSEGDGSQTSVRMTVRLDGMPVGYNSCLYIYN